MRHKHLTNDSFKNFSIRKASMLLLKKPEARQSQLEAPDAEAKTFTDLLRLYWQQYCAKSTIHGVRYIYDPTLKKFERLIWTALVITSVSLTCLAYIMLSERYEAQTLQTVVQNSQYPVFQIPFPAIGVCTINRINWQKLEEAKARFLPPSSPQNVIDVFTTFVERLGSMAFGHFESFMEMDDINLELLDNIDISELAKFMSLRCEDIIEKNSCFWRREPFDCCKFFIMERTEMGYCLIFNSVMSPESLALQRALGSKFYPFPNSKGGQGSGLKFHIQLQTAMKSPNSHHEETVILLIKRPDEIYNSAYTISPSTETYAIIRPEITESDKNVRVLTPEKRSCLFEDETFQVYTERPLHINRNVLFNNCLNICHEKHLRRYCNCTLPMFFQSTDPKTELCRASHFRCLAKHNDIFSYDKRSEEDAYFSSAKPGMTCACLIPCNIVEYFTSLTTLPLTTVHSTFNETDQLFHVDVHYRAEVGLQYRKSLEFTSIDLIANFGGIFGLCLGASLVSAVELLYYLTFGFGLYLYDNNYYTILKRNIRELRMKWATGIRDTLNDDYQDNARKASFVAKRPQQKKNNWATHSRN